MSYFPQLERPLKHFCGVGVLWLLCAWASVAVGRELFVDNQTGDDGRNGRAATVDGNNGPFRTIARALKEADFGDRIIIAKTPDPYRESITLQGGRHSGIAGGEFEIVGNGAVVDGSRSVPQGWWKHFRGDVFRFRPPKMSFQTLFLDGVPAVRKYAEKASNRLPNLEPLEWCLFNRHVYFRTSEQQVPQSFNLAYTALPVGITIYETRHVIVRDLVIQGFQLDGVNAHDNAFDTLLVGLTCRGNGRSGISVGGASRAEIVASLVGSNGEAQVRTEGKSHTILVNCDLVEHDVVPKLDRRGGEVRVEGSTNLP